MTKHRRLSAAVCAAALMTALTSAIAAHPAAASPNTEYGDFNGDGRDDLAIGIPGASVNGAAGAGAVQVLYGTADGLSSSGQQFLRQGFNGLEDTAEAGDHFGQALAKGDVNHDGFADLVVGVPGEDVVTAGAAGSIVVIHGGPGGLGDDFVVTQNRSGVEDDAEAGDNFGAALAAGDFDNDEFADVAVGVPGENGGAGGVNVLYGAAPFFDLTRDQFWTQDSTDILDASEPGDAFGRSLVAGNFDFTAGDDLAIGVPLEDVTTSVTTLSDAGGVNVIYSRPLLGLTARNASGLVDNQLWTQESGGITGLAASGEEFGDALAAGDFNHQEGVDLAIGIPKDSIEGQAVGTVGSVEVLYGLRDPATADGLSATDSQRWTQSAVGAGGGSEPFDFFGDTLAAGDFNNDGEDDLAIASPGEDVTSNTVFDAGSVDVLYGTSGPGLSTAHSLLMTQASLDTPDTSEQFDSFGQALYVADFNGKTGDDLAIGVPLESLELPSGTFNSAGQVNIVYGRNPLIAFGGLDPTRDSQLWNQSTTATGPQPQSFFGSAVS
ncbi:FG-GAP repeat protein [Streptosporangiaceae bacterium NEAU-GS5]|nr:FG-GAP repeat protein [Streptosporangiaceae bacterium NEAU-GS5]